MALPKRFNLLQRKVIEEADGEVEGVVVEKREGGWVRVAVLGFVDDSGQISGKGGQEQIENWLKVRKRLASKYRFKWKESKDKVLVRGKGRRNEFRWNREGGKAGKRERGGGTRGGTNGSAREVEGTGEKNGREDEETSKESGMVSFSERVEKY